MVLFTSQGFSEHPEVVRLIVAHWLIAVLPVAMLGLPSTAKQGLPSVLAGLLAIILASLPGVPLMLIQRLEELRQVHEVHAPMIDLDVVVASLLHPPGVKGQFRGTSLVKGHSVLEWHLRVVGAMNDEYRGMCTLDLHDILEHIEPEGGLDIMDHTEATLQGTMQDDATNIGPRGQINRGHAAHRLPVADDLLFGNAAVVREVVVRSIHISKEVCLARHSRTLAVAAVLVGKDIDRELGAKLLQVVEHDPDVRAIAVAEEDCPGGVNTAEVEAKDDIATTRVHPDGVHHDALRAEVRQWCQSIVSLDKEDLLLLSDVVARRLRREEGHLVHDASHKARNE
mmetsp:Transcript_135389/g.235453  ORF Transcript_135389/g.235453 Transcript_135389/m.235453 type:complete len:340 (+) Transcript_135389:22-1041(+)